jgi:hypothetical protein
MPGHFTVEGGKKYGYQPRKGDDEPPYIERMTRWSVHQKHQRLIRSPNPSYSWRKRRQLRHNKPLVWSGQSEHMAKQQVRLSTRVNRASGTAVATAAMNLPKYFYQYLKPGYYARPNVGDGKGLMHITHQTPDKANELTRTTEVERAELAVFYEAKMSDRLSVLSKVNAMKRIR